jgi:sortase A
VTFEREEPHVDGEENRDAADLPGDQDGAADHDEWLKKWLNSEEKPAAKGKKRSGDVADRSEASEASADAESDTSVGDTTSPKNTKRFAAAVADFREKTPVLLDPPEPEEDLEADIIIEGGPEQAPRTFFGKIKSAFLSDRTTSAFGVVGELLITGGTVVLLFLAWQLWINNAIVAGEQAEAVKEFSNGLSSSPSATAKWTPKAGAIDYGPAPVLESVGQNAAIGNMYVPRLGSGSTRAVANGVTDAGATINRGYYGRYEDSQWPGEPGNFAVAVHRNGWGTSFTNAHLIRPGDNFYLETPQGWYIYTIRNTEYVVPTQVDVVNPMPMSEDPPVDGQSIMTITTCSPMNGNGERLIVYGILTSWQPLEAGVPAEITKLVEEARS